MDWSKWTSRKLWTSVGAAAVGVAVAFGALSPDAQAEAITQVDKVIDALTRLTGAAGAILSLLGFVKAEGATDAARAAAGNDR